MNQPGAAFSSTSAARVCQPLPEDRQRSSTSVSTRNVTGVLREAATLPLDAVSYPITLFPPITVPIPSTLFDPVSLPSKNRALKSFRASK